MREKTGKIGFIAATVILVLIAAFFFSSTVMSRQKLSNAEIEAYYMPLEAQMVRDARSYLSDLGYVNSGVTLTRVIDSEGYRTYTLTVHHGEIDKLEEAQRKELSRELSAVDFEDSRCSFFHEFLVVK